MCLHHRWRLHCHHKSAIWYSFLSSTWWCDFQCLVHSDVLEIIILFSIWSKDSLYPASRSRATMELSPHPNDIRVRSLHMSVSWQLVIPIVKDALLTEVVIRDVQNWLWWVSDCCLVRLIGKTHVFLKVILIRCDEMTPLRLPRPLLFQRHLLQPEKFWNSLSELHFWLQ